MYYYPNNDNMIDYNEFLKLRQDFNKCQFSEQGTYLYTVFFPLFMGHLLHIQVSHK